MRTFAKDRTSATFRHQLGPIAGYAYDYTKRLSLEPGLPRLKIAHTLRNTGTKPISTRVYNHNFLTFGGTGIAQDIALSTPFSIKSANPPPAAAARIENNKVVYAKRVVDRERVSLGIEGFGPTAADHRFYIENPSLGAGVQIIGDRPLFRAALWSIRAVMAIEPFVQIDVAPGAESSWSQTYDYWAGRPERT